MSPLYWLSPALPRFAVTNWSPISEAKVTSPDQALASAEGVTMGRLPLLVMLQVVTSLRRISKLSTDAVG
jgi:hypothetical protein